MLKEVKKLVEKGDMLPLMEEFYTIQGEGYHKGTAAYFVRIGGCDVGCHWCDVKESWNAKLHPPTETKKIVESAFSYSNTVVVTGGEPLTWNMGPLTSQFKKKGMQVHIETSGAYELTGEWDWICLSPKKFKAPCKEAYSKANELKVVIAHPSDIEWAKTHAEKVSPTCKLYVQPEWSKQEWFLSNVIDFVKENEKINPHKLIKVYFNYYGFMKPFFCDKDQSVKYARLINNFEGNYKSFKNSQAKVWEFFYALFCFRKKLGRAKN